jgi:hypothetical protein
MDDSRWSAVRGSSWFDGRGGRNVRFERRGRRHSPTTGNSSRWGAATTSAASTSPSARGACSGSAASNGAFRSAPTCTWISWITSPARNIYLAPFYDVGNCYVNGHELGTNAHAVGAGLRVDVTWLGMIERTTLRFDIAKTVNGNYPVQFWFGIQHPF